MLVKMLKSKLHGATVTDAKVHYTGSILIDEKLMHEAWIASYETVLVADVTNGNRLETYALPAPAGSGQIVMLGAAAKLIQPKDEVIIFSFCYCDADEVKEAKPRIIIVDENNGVKESK
ncbi:MAG: aspartate 1-decarboxylase [Sedimentisphaerales bacterium]|nr:aspartate 1-decarboxylase [Sedimentisphaerales bacterium]